jgi:hypothetical protein
MAAPALLRHISHLPSCLYLKSIRFVQTCLPLERAELQVPRVTCAISGYTHNNSRIVEGVNFYAFRVVPKESKRLVLPRTSCLNYYVLRFSFSG